MIDFFTSNFKRGLVKIKENPQLAYTLFTAVVIFFAFIFVSASFLSIARDAQEKLINVRIGMMQDSFVEFVYDYFEKPEELNKKIESLSEDNQTIVDFEVVRFLDDEVEVVSSLNREEIGEIKQKSFVYSMINLDPSQSVTSEQSYRGERFFITSRAIRDENGRVVGAVLTRQTLSQTDKAIADNVNWAIFVLLIVLVFVMLLFFRHAKIVDYAVLYRKIEQVNKMKDEFISMTSHELRTPLTAIRGYADMLKDFENSEEQELFIKNIEMQSNRLNDLVNDILDTSRIEQGRLSIELEKFDPKEDIEEIIDSLNHSAKEKNLNLVNDIKNTDLILADRSRLKQVMINLIGNSIKYTEEGEVRVSSETKDNFLVFKVADTGIGMSAEEQKGLFQKFYRIKSEKTENIIGTGLGLWITKRLIENMKGKISVESIQGKGTVMIVKVPLAD